LDFYGQILLWPPKYAHEWPVQAAWLGCTNVGGTPAVGLHPPHPETIRELIAITLGDSETCHSRLAPQVVANLCRGSCQLTGFFTSIV